MASQVALISRMPGPAGGLPPRQSQTPISKGRGHVKAPKLSRRGFRAKSVLFFNKEMHKGLYTLASAGKII